MHFRNEGKSESSITQNQFTAYLLSALHRKKRDILNRKYRMLNNEVLVDFQEYQVDSRDEELLQFGFDNSVDEIIESGLEDEKLEKAIHSLSRLEKKIFLGRIIEELEFQEIAEQTGLTHSAVTARYYRILKKIRQDLNGGGKTCISTRCYCWPNEEIARCVSRY